MSWSDNLMLMRRSFLKEVSASEMTQAAAAATPDIRRVLDIVCGAGNNTLKLLRATGGTAACDLCDLSLPMLERARERVSVETTGAVRTYQMDRMREAGFSDIDVLHKNSCFAAWGARKRA